MVVSEVRYATNKESNLMAYQCCYDDNNDLVCCRLPGFDINDQLITIKKLGNNSTNFN